MLCSCGRTVYDPPIPCGTIMQCNYPCSRPPPPCGHPRVPHTCHPNSSQCPPCAHLTTKECACGKKTVHNVRCSLEREKVSCGSACGKLLSCGFHHCERSCHADNCGRCTAPCGKVRKLWCVCLFVCCGSSDSISFGALFSLPDHHLCTEPCHAPSSCSETEPCQSLVVVTCPCGRNRRTALCGRSMSQPEGQQCPSPKCTNECGITKRNARLAEVLGINPTKSGTTGTNASMGGYGGLVNTVTYSDEVIGFARANVKFLPVVEKAFAEFVGSSKKTQMLPHMSPDRRKFVHDVSGFCFSGRRGVLVDDSVFYSACDLLPD